MKEQRTRKATLIRLKFTRVIFTLYGVCKTPNMALVMCSGTTPPREGIQEFMGVGIDLSSPEGFRKTMGLADVFLLRKEVEGLMRYTAAWVEQLQNDVDVVEVRTVWVDWKMGSRLQ